MAKKSLTITFSGEARPGKLEAITTVLAAIAKVSHVSSVQPVLHLTRDNRPAEMQMELGEFVRPAAATAMLRDAVHFATFGVRVETDGQADTVQPLYKVSKVRDNNGRYTANLTFL